MCKKTSVSLRRFVVTFFLTFDRLSYPNMQIQDIKNNKLKNVNSCGHSKSNVIIEEIKRD
jgi:hypothetical protein